MKATSLKAYKEKKKSILSVNPYTEELMAEIPLMTWGEIEEQVRRSRDAFNKWRATPGASTGRGAVSR